jgi:hypothetical protein
MSFLARRPLPLLVLALGLIVGATWLIGRSQAEPQTDDTPKKQTRSVEAMGLDCFRRLLYDLQEEYGFLPIGELGQALQDPSHSLIIVLGNPEWLGSFEPRGENRWLEAYLQLGGALFVATDQHTPPLLLRTFPFEVTGRLLTIDPNSEHSYKRGSPNARYCPILDVTPSAQTGMPIFKNLRRIATNRPSYIEGVTVPGLLAQLPEVCQPPPIVQASRPFAVGGLWRPRDMLAGPGARVLVLADHSVFINCMMLQEDNDNIALANNCLEWLLAAPDGQRRRQVLYVEDGRVRTDFYVPLDEPKLPELTTESANAFLAALEEDNTLNRIFSRKISHDTAFVALAVVSCLCLLVYGFFRISGARYRVESGAPLFSSALARLAPAGGVVELRSQGMFKERNFQDAARIAAQQFFATLPDAAVHATSAPQIQANGSWWRRWALRREVKRMWELAESRTSRRYSASQFVHLLARIEHLRTALATSHLRLEFRS